MRRFVIMMLALSFLSLNVFLLRNFVESNPRWDQPEVGVQIGLSALLTIISAALFLLDVGRRKPLDAAAEPSMVLRNRLAVIFWTIALVWSLLLGSFFFVELTATYQSRNHYRVSGLYDSAAMRREIEAIRDWQEQLRSYRTGIWYSKAILGTAGISAIGLLLTIFRGRRNRKLITVARDGEGRNQESGCVTGSMETQVTDKKVAASMDFERFETKSHAEAVMALFDQALPSLSAVTVENIHRICSETLKYEVKYGNRHLMGAADRLRPIITQNLARAAEQLPSGQRIIGFQVMIQPALYFVSLGIVIGDAQGSPGYMFGAKLWRTTDQVFVLGWEGFQLSF